MIANQCTTRSCGEWIDRMCCIAAPRSLSIGKIRIAEKGVETEI